MLEGYKTYLVAAAIIIYAVCGYWLGYVDAPKAGELILTGLGFAGLRSGIAKAAPLVLLALLLPAQSHAADPGILMSAEKAAALRSYFPECANPKFNELFAAADLYWTEEEMPPMQQQGGTLVAPRTGGTRDGNIDFPWKVTAGVHNCTGISSFKFLTLPKRDGEESWPVVYQSRTPLDVARDGDNTFTWFFPVGATVGEVLAFESPSGQQFPFEVRLRTREERAWSVNVLRNFTTARNLADGIAILRPEWQSDAQLVAAMESLESKPRIVKHKITDAGLHGNGGRTTFTSTDLYETLPELPAELVHELLGKAVFEDATDSAWRELPDGKSVFAPTADGFNVVPAKYTGAMLGTNSESCLRCHEDTGKRSTRVNNSWLGHIRGSDGIFSFQPGTVTDDNRVIVRQELKDRGLFVKYDPAIHPSDRYTQIPFLRHEQ